jgi:hypothetical protein
MAGPQAATEAAGVVTACRVALGMAPQPTSTVAELGGQDAAAVAATLTPPAGSNAVGAEQQTPQPPVLDESALLRGERAYDFVTSLNTLDNWRALPADTLARWAIDPPSQPLPAGASLLPGLPADQINAVPADGQPASAYARGCATVISRATRVHVDAPGTDNKPPPTQVGADALAHLAALAGDPVTNLELLRVVDPSAVQDDPRQFYMNYQPTSHVSAGEIVVYDFSIAGPAHFGIALDDQQMVSTGSFTAGVAEIRPIPTNVGAMSATPLRPDDRQTGATP